MGNKRRILAVLAGAAIVAGIAVTAAFGAHRATPGITATTVTIGGTFPLSGPAALYKTIPAAEGAYFAYINDKGGVNGRKIDFKVLDDGYDPSKTVPLTQQLVEQTNVFAVFGSLGTAPNLSTWSYLNSHKVPQVVIATGDSYWGFSAKKYPWTIGYQPDYPGEAKIYGKYLNANFPTAKIGVLYQNDAYGKNYRDCDEGRLDTRRNDHQQRLGESGLPEDRRSQRRRCGRRAFDELPQPRHGGELGHAGSRAGEGDHREVRAGPRPERLERRLWVGRRVDIRVRAATRRQEPDPGEPHEGSQEPRGRRSVLISGDQAADLGEGQLPDRAARVHQVGGRHRRSVGAVRQPLQQGQVARQTLS